MISVVVFFFFFEAEDGIRDLVRSRGLGDVYKRQPLHFSSAAASSLVAGYMAIGIVESAALHGHGKISER